jgi:hypothetical protein
MIARNCSLPHELVCATDDAIGLDNEIRVAPLERQLIDLGNAFPKLAAFRPNAEQLFGKRICVLDLDTVIVGSLDNLLERLDEFIIWKDVLSDKQPARFKYNTSFFIMDAAARVDVWQTFSAKHSPIIIRREGRCGSDQAWVSHVLDNEKTVSAGDGVLSWKFEVRDHPPHSNERIIFFHGKTKPWHLPNDSIVKEHWR